MRLGQLSRKLAITIPEIASAIAKEFDITIGEHPNIKLDDAHVDYLTKKFVISEEKTPKKAEEENEEDINPRVKIETTDKDAADEASENAQSETEESAPLEEETKEIETIRAKAAKLEGLKVVDKIELPEPPPPEMVEIDGVMYDKAELKKQRIAERKEREANRKKEAEKRAAERKTRVKKKPVKRELSFAEKRRLEEKREADKKKKEEKFKRKRQRKHYESKHKATPPANNKKKKKEMVEVEVEEVIVENRPEPKSLLGKFWRWLNTY